VDTIQALAEISGQVAVCTRCQLHYSRKKSVPGEGPVNSEVMLIGEGPGFYENEQGRPFVGAAGKFLDELLEKGGVKREGVFITNVVKCRPPGNRDPLPEELSACNDYLERQIETINPLVIVTLGRYSMGKFMPNAKISEVHGQAMTIRGRLIIPMYHPAAALHQPSLKTTLERDFARLTDLIQQAKHPAQPKAAAAQVANAPSAPTKAPVQPPTQSRLFGSEPKPAEPKPEPSNDTPTQLSLF
jgi:uracil-DNA glycosylase family 4